MTAAGGAAENRWKPSWVLTGILALAAFMRLWKLGSLPPAIFRDEAEKGLNAWFLWNGGVDAEGHVWPLFIKVFGVTTSAIYQYAALPFVAMGGLNEWTVRLPAAVVGIGTVALVWMLCRKVWDVRVAACAAAMLALSPWHIPLTRWAQQGVFLPLLFTGAAAGLGWALAEIKDSNRRWAGARGLAVAGVCVGLAMYAYDPARLFGPLWVGAAALVWLAAR